MHAAVCSIDGYGEPAFMRCGAARCGAVCDVNQPFSVTSNCSAGIPFKFKVSDRFFKFNNGENLNSLSVIMLKDLGSAFIEI